LVGKERWKEKQGGRGKEKRIRFKVMLFLVIFVILPYKHPFGKEHKKCSKVSIKAYKRNLINFSLF
jgi:hypothetical protein